MSTIYFKTAAGQTAFTDEEPVGQYVIEFPLGPQEPTALLVRQNYWQVRASYARPAANTTLSYGAQTAYFVDDVNFQDVTGSVVQWTRTWATVPAQWSDPQSYAYSFPAVTAGSGTAFAVTGITASSPNTIFTISAGTIAVGDSVYVAVTYTRNGTVQSQSFNSVAVATTNSGQVTVPLTLPGSGSFSSVSGNVYKVQPGRAEPINLVVASRVQYDYALTSTTAIDADLPIYPLFQPVITSTFTATQYLNTLTTPTAATYRTMMQNQTEIVVESIRRRYMGNIYERATRYIKAQ